MSLGSYTCIIRIQDFRASGHLNHSSEGTCALLLPGERTSFREHMFAPLGTSCQTHSRCNVEGSRKWHWLQPLYKVTLSSKQLRRQGRNDSFEVIAE